MLRDIFKSLGNFENYGLISMVIFVIFFILLIIHTMSLKTGDVDEYSRMPLDDGAKEKDEIHDI
ncbi:MAG: cbb3-type cytochrome c oxidase subunit 3 [Bacteroidetes bacterium]|nr:cbb3-type cytochrome c oxidase subunit 3 [Bacteroidota bacterium]